MLWKRGVGCWTVAWKRTYEEGVDALEKGVFALEMGFSR